MTKSRNLIAQRRFWSEVDLQLLREAYPHTKTELIAQALGRDIGGVYQKAQQLGLAKSEAYLAGDLAGRIQRGKQSDTMKATQFRPGQAAWNKGTKGIVGVQEACRATQFKKGRPAHEAANYLPIGSERINRDGHLERKVTDDPTVVPARRWVPVYRLVWAAAHGPIPPGHMVRFRPGMATTDPALITVDKLDCVTRQQHMLQHTYHQYGPDIDRVVQLRGAITRQINKRAKDTA